MKNYILAILAFCISFSANGQTIPIDSFYVPGATWIEAAPTYWPDYHAPRDGAQCKIFRIERDTVVSGINYHVVSKMDAGSYEYRSTSIGSGYVTTLNTTPPTNVYEAVGRIRVDSNKVFFTRDINTPEYNGPTSEFDFGVEYLLYDFNLGIGSSVSDFITTTYPAIYVDSIDSVTLSPGVSAAKYVDSLRSGHYWIRGIGSNQGFLRKYYHLYAPESTYYYYFKPDNFTLCYSNPSLSISYQFYYPDQILTGNLQRNCFDLGKLAVNEHKVAEGGLVIYPNPTTDDYFNVEGIKPEVIKEVVISDVTGKTRSLLHYPFAAGKTQVYFRHEPGVYIVRFEFEDGSVVTRRVNKL